MNQIMEESIDESADDYRIGCTKLIFDFDEKCNIAVLESTSDDEFFKDSNCVVTVDEKLKRMMTLKILLIDHIKVSIIIWCISQ